MCIRDSHDHVPPALADRPTRVTQLVFREADPLEQRIIGIGCLLYTSDAADERSSVDLGGRRIIKKKKRKYERHVVAGE